MLPPRRDKPLNYVRVRDETESLCTLGLETETRPRLSSLSGTDGLTSFVYYTCWNILGDALTEVVEAVHHGSHPTPSQRTSMMVFGTKPKNGNSILVNDKRRLSQLNSDFKIITGIENYRFKSTATHTLSSCQLAVGTDRRIHHGINTARDAIAAATM